MAARAVGVLSSISRSSGEGPGQTGVVARAVVCTHSVVGTSCRYLCSGRGQMQTDMFWWGQDKQQGPRPAVGSLAVSGALAVSVLSFGCTESPWTFILWEADVGGCTKGVQVLSERI